ncbi:MAG: hypothetical protein ACYCOU_04925, partial [Sulfobacillus sp.]
GCLILTMPNQESLRSLLSLIFRKHFVAFQDRSYPAHITALLRLDLLRICRESSFSAPTFLYTNSGAVPKITSIRWQQISSKLFCGRLFSDNLVMIAYREDR